MDKLTVDRQLPRDALLVCRSIESSGRSLTVIGLSFGMQAETFGVPQIEDFKLTKGQKQFNIDRWLK